MPGNEGILGSVDFRKVHSQEFGTQRHAPGCGTVTSSLDLLCFAQGTCNPQHSALASHISNWAISSCWVKQRLCVPKGPKNKSLLISQKSLCLRSVMLHQPPKDKGAGQHCPWPLRMCAALPHNRVSSTGFGLSYTVSSTR